METGFNNRILRHYLLSRISKSALITNNNNAQWAEQEARFADATIECKMYKIKADMTNAHLHEEANEASTATDIIYNILFCDDMELYKANHQQQPIYPWNILFAEDTETPQLLRLLNDSSISTRIKLLALHKLRLSGLQVNIKDLLAVIVEVGLEEGTDVLAVYNDGSIRYINQSGKMIFWDVADETSTAHTQKLFQHSEEVVKQIGPWNKPRRPAPLKGMLRLNFLVFDGLYFGEAPIDVLYRDPLASPVLMSATSLLQYITAKAVAARN